jgi:ABC-type sugar transport system ATPase subunit
MGIKPTFLQLKNISKAYPGVQALDNVSISIRKGEVHALVGENGAGKSTLIKILAGAIQSDSGEIILKGKPIDLHTPADGLKNGISVIYQELLLLPYLTIAENIFLHKEPTNKFGLINYRKMHDQAKQVLNQLDIKLDTRMLVGQLSIAQQQLVEIAKGLASDAQILVMDEPTAALSEHEVSILFDVIHTLKSNLVTVIYISHRLKEVFEISDQITVLKDGQLVSSMPIEDMQPAELINMMVGRSISKTFPPTYYHDQDSEDLLKVVDLSTRGIVKNVSFTLHRGEILGLAGLVGSGRTELAQALYGIVPITSGSIIVRGKELPLKSSKNAIWAGIGLVTEDRKKEGLVIIHSIKQNIALPSLYRREKLGVINQKEEVRDVNKIVSQLRISTPSINQIVGYLSGGNQQKVVLAKLLLNDPDILIFDEPTRGIDVGAKTEIYQLMRLLAEQGKAILMISSELTEILGMSDRILVMSEGQIAGELSRSEATEEKIMHFATFSL